MRIPTIPILYEDEHILVINKPAGIMVHPDGRSEEKTLVDWILKKYPEMKGVGEPISLDGGEVIDRPGIVHRLDKDTSGALILAKDQEAFDHLKAQFQARTIKKAYRAFVYGELKDERGVIDLPIARSKSDFRKWTAQRGKRGEVREATTNYTVLKHTKLASYIEARPLTGRTHQIRVHMKAIHHPVIADILYGEDKPAILGFTRHALHGQRIDFENLDGERVQVEAPLPKDFEDALKELSEELA